MAAPYSDELYQTTKAKAKTPQITNIDDVNNCNPVICEYYEGFTMQSDFSFYLALELSGLHNQDKGQGIKLFARPHTQAELQAAGMWPY